MSNSTPNVTSAAKPLDLPKLACALAGVCSGCAWIDRPYQEQVALKRAALTSVWTAALPSVTMPPIKWVAVAEGGLRDRADLILDRRSGESRLGLFRADSREIIDIEACPQLSPRLQSFVDEFREIPLDIERGSVRLRVSPFGDRGLWLDLANIDVKHLLDERNTLLRLQHFGIVEIGQRRKRLIERENALKLGDPTMHPWFETYVGPDEKSAPLFMTIGSFSQPGFEANRALVREATRLFSARPGQRAVEFGSGTGNFTLPLAAAFDHVDAFESDALACDGLRLGAMKAGLEQKITVHQGDFQRLSAQRDAQFASRFNNVDLIFVDPPRSGLMGFLDPLAQLPQRERPKSLVYVSCFAESFAQDSRRLYEMGYLPTQMTIVDQFPQSPHFEIVARFELS